MSTIRERLSLAFDAKTVNNIERVGKDTPYDILDYEVEGGNLCIGNDAGMFVFCSGEAIACFWNRSKNLQIYLVRDDGAGEVWDAELQRAMRENRSLPGGLPFGKPRTSTKIKLVIAC